MWREVSTLRTVSSTQVRQKWHCFFLQTSSGNGCPDEYPMIYHVEYKRVQETINLNLTEQLIPQYDNTFFSYSCYDKTTLPMKVSPAKWFVSLSGLYYHHTLTWLRYFPLNQIHFVDGENLISRPWEEMERVENFLGVDRLVTRERWGVKEFIGVSLIYKLNW